MSLVHFSFLDEFAVPVFNQIRQEQIVAEQESVERVQQHTAEQHFHVPIPHFQEQIVESIQVFPRELFPERIDEQIVDMPCLFLRLRKRLRAGVMWSSNAAAHAAPTPAIEHVAPALAVAKTTPAPVIDYVTPLPVLEYIAPAPAVTSVTTGVNLDITSLGAEILVHEKEIHHCQRHINRTISDLKTGEEKLQRFEKIQADLRERLARASRRSRGSLRERNEVQIVFHSTAMTRS